MSDKYTIDDAPAQSKYTVEDAAPPAPQQSWWDRVTAPYTEIQKPDPNAPALSGKEAIKAVGNIGAGGLGVILHPINTLAGIGGMIMAPGEMMAGKKFSETVPGQFVQQFKENPLGTIEAGIGQAGAAPFLDAEAKVATSPVRIIPKVARGGMDILAGTTPKVATELGAKTLEDNVAAQAKADAANAAAESKRSQQLQTHFDKTQAIRAQNEAAEATQSRKVALQRGVEQLDPKFKEDLTALKNKVNEEANAKYTELNKALDPFEADPEKMRVAMADAVESIKGSTTEPTILKDMSRKLENGNNFTYEDLQGYYSEIGRELQKGTLPGDIYHAYDILQESLGEQMQRIADSQNLGPQLADARQTWRNMKQTFYDPKSPITKALKAVENGKSIQALSGAHKAGIEALAKYDPELARRANTIRGYQAEAKSITAKPTAPKPEPVLPPKPPPSVAQVKKVGLKDIQQAKQDVMMGKKGPAGGKLGHLAAGAGAWHILSSAMYGNPEGVALGAAVSAAPYALARVLKSPGIVRMLSEPTPADIAAIPPEVRGDLPAIVDAAQKQGIKVHPSILLMARPNAPNQ